MTFSGRPVGGQFLDSCMAGDYTFKTEGKEYTTPLCVREGDAEEYDLKKFTKEEESR